MKEMGLIYHSERSRKDVNVASETTVGTRITDRPLC